jgi:hypothetical protein
MNWRAKWKLWVAVSLSIMMAGYIVQFVNSHARNKPALFFAWAMFLGALSFYRWYRGGLTNEIEAKRKLRDEKEFQSWANSRNREVA